MALQTSFQWCHLLRNVGFSNKQLKILLDKIFTNEIICVRTKLRYQEHYNGKQSITQKFKDRATRAPLKQGVYACAPEGIAVPSPRVTPVMLLLNDTNNIYKVSHDSY